eukprot:6617_1
MGTCCQSEADIAFHRDQSVIDSEVTDIKDTYTFGPALGHGASCTVVEATVTANPQEKVAIKVMGKSHSHSKQMFQHEVDILTKLSEHAGILPFKGHAEDRTHYYIVTHFLSGGELFDRIISDDDKYKITEKMAVKFVLTMLEAVKHCHDNHIVHRDLKPENFVFSDDRVDSQLILIDFGTSCFVNDDEVYEDLKGTPDYMSPECAALALKRKDAKKLTAQMLKASDVWGMGIIVYIMMTGMAPFRGATTTGIFQSLCDEPLRFPYEDVRYHNKLKLTELFQDFMRKILNKNPMERLTIEQAIHHPWVQGVEATDYVLNKAALQDLKQFAYESRLKKEVTHMLAAHAGADPSKDVLAHFKRLDVDGDGVLELNELKQLLLDMGYVGHTAEEEAREMMKTADLNNDGVIDLQEFTDIWYRKVLKTNDLYIHRVFNVFDKDGDGTIDASELAAIFYSNDKNGNEEERFTHAQTIKRMINEVDANGDGKIDFEEFKHAMKEDIAAGKYKGVLSN